MKHEPASLTTAQGRRVVLRSVQAQGRLEGLLLSMTLRQVFRNETKKNLEVTYTFPLAWGAVLLGLQATLGGKRMTGQVLARQEARERYEDAVEQGDAPVMVEKTRSGVFSASLGSLKPGEEAVIELSYAQLLSFEQGRIRLVVPTTLAPRYGDPVRQGKLQPDQVAAPDLLAEHAFGVSITLTGALAQARIGSPSHAVTQQRQGNGDGSGDGPGDAVTISLQGPAWLDRDFVLLLEGLEGHSFAIAGPDAASGPGHHAVVASYCPALPATEPAPLRLKLLVDCSGSMSGDSIAQARAALRPLVTTLTAQDEVSFSRFGDRPQRVLGAGSVTPHHINALAKAIEATDADLGGTEMGAALQDTFAIRMGAARHSEDADVLLITDGEVWDAQRIVDEARRSGHRVYALGVGSAPAESLLREMADATGGACEFATPHEDMALAIERLLARIRLALPVQARLEMAGQALWASPLPRRLAAGETVHQFLRLPGQPAQAPTLQLAGQAATHAHLSVREDDLIARLVAARQIGATTDTAQAREIAERYQLVTEETNLLLVFERAQEQKTDGLPDLHKVQPMLAAGWGGSGRMRFGKEITTSAAGLNVPSVWRTNRSAGAAKIDALAAGGLDDYEIPAFLRRQSDGQKPPATEPINEPVTPPQFLIAEPALPVPPPAAERLIAAFNAAASPDQTFRASLRAVLALTVGTTLDRLMTQASQQVNGVAKAWACYLLWVHEEGAQSQRLSAQALALVAAEIGKILPEDVVAARELFRQAEREAA